MVAPSKKSRILFMKMSKEYAGTNNRLADNMLRYRPGRFFIGEGERNMARGPYSIRSYHLEL